MTCAKGLCLTNLIKISGTQQRRNIVSSDAENQRRRPSISVYRAIDGWHLVHRIAKEVVDGMCARLTPVSAMNRKARSVVSCRYSILYSGRRQVKAWLLSTIPDIGR